MLTNYIVNSNNMYLLHTAEVDSVSKVKINLGGSETRVPPPVQEVMRSNLGWGSLKSLGCFLPNQLHCWLGIARTLIHESM